MTSQADQKPEKSTCDYCGKQLYGREGKKYCNVDCKNNYNSKIRSELRTRENKYFPQIFDQIKKNYRILLSYNLSEHGTREIHVEKEELDKLGFYASYCTTAYLDPDKKIRRYCYDHSWTEGGYNTIKIRFGTY